MIQFQTYSTSAGIHKFRLRFWMSLHSEYSPNHNPKILKSPHIIKNALSLTKLLTKLRDRTAPVIAILLPSSPLEILDGSVMYLYLYLPSSSHYRVHMMLELGCKSQIGRSWSHPSSPSPICPGHTPAHKPLGNTAHYTLRSSHCPLHTAHWTVHTSHIAHYSLHTAHWSLYIAILGTAQH